MAEFNRLFVSLFTLLPSPAATHKPPQSIHRKWDIPSRIRLMTAKIRQQVIDGRKSYTRNAKIPHSAQPILRLVCVCSKSKIEFAKKSVPVLSEPNDFVRSSSRSLWGPGLAWHWRQSLRRWRAVGRSVGGDGRVLYLRVILDRPHAKPNISNMRKYTHGAFKLLSGLSISIYRPQTISNYERIHLSQVNEVLNHFYSLAQLLDDDDDGQK